MGKTTKVVLGVVGGKHSLWEGFDDFENGRGRWASRGFDRQW